MMIPPDESGQLVHGSSRGHKPLSVYRRSGLSVLFLLRKHRIQTATCSSEGMMSVHGRTIHFPCKNSRYKAVRCRDTSHPATKLQGAHAHFRQSSLKHWESAAGCACNENESSRIGTLKKMMFQELALDLVTTAQLKYSRLNN